MFRERRRFTQAGGQANVLKPRTAAFLTICAGFGIITILAMWAMLRTNTPETARIVGIYPPVFDFGTVFQAQTINHQFSLSNLSEDVLCVVGIKTTCSCTVVVADSLVGKTIPPRGALTIPVDYAVGEREGLVSSFVSVFVAATNAMDHLYQLQAQMRGNVLPEFVIVPASLDFGSLNPGEQFTQTVTFLPRDARNLKIFDPVSTVEAFRVVLQGKTSDSYDAPTTAAITFKAPTNATRQETLSADVQFATSSARIPKASIYVIGKVIPDVEILPSMVIVPSSGLDKSSYTELTIHTRRPSRVVHMTGQEPNTSPKGELFNDSATVDAWNKTHYLRVPNRSLEKALGVSVELNVHDGPDRIEARSVFVPIKSLKFDK